MNSILLFAIFLIVIVAHVIQGFVIPQTLPQKILLQQQQQWILHRRPLLILYETTPKENKNDETFPPSKSSFTKNNNDNEDFPTTTASDAATRSSSIRARVKKLAKKIAMRPFTSAASVASIPMPRAIAAILKDATLAAVEEVVDEVMEKKSTILNGRNKGNSNYDGDDELSLLNDSEVSSLIEEAFEPLEVSLQQLQKQITITQEATQTAKLQTIQAIQIAAVAQAQGAAQAVAQAEQVAENEILQEIFDNDDTKEDPFLYQDMAPPFLDPDSCLVPGEPVIRIEKAPENSRRIFAGIDVLASVDDVWECLTTYDKLQNVVPNLVVNEVLELYNGTDKPYQELLSEYRMDSIKNKDSDKNKANNDINYQIQCMQQLANQMKGARLKQVGGAKVAGMKFSARTTLDVREWPYGLPDFAHFNDKIWNGKSRLERAQEYTKTKLTRYCFPRPFAISASTPTKDISMQSIPNDNGEFRLYQGVWRMQPLVGCAPPGQSAMRLTYAVEISPRAYLPVQLIEGRIVQDLCTNLEAIRKFVTDNNKSKTIVSSDPTEQKQMTA